MRLSAPLLALLLVACGPSFVERPTQVVWDDSADDFWSLPLPATQRTRADGSFGLDRYPGKRTALSNLWLQTANKRVRDGWATTGGVFFTTTGPIDAATLQDKSAFLIDVDPNSPERGRRFPLTREFTKDAGPLHPANLVALIPPLGFVRRPNTAYAAVLTDFVTDESGTALGRSKKFHDAFTKADGDFGDLKALLAEQQIPESSVVAATVFRTFDPADHLKKLSAWAEAQPAIQLTGAPEPKETYPTFQVMVGQYTVPKIQTGERPGDGLIVWQGDQPVKNGEQTTRVVLSIPRQPMPPGGFPLMIYFHGSGGEAYENVDRGPLPMSETRGTPPLGSGPAKYLTERGIATLGFDFPLHGKRKDPPDTTGLELYNLFGDIDETIDNMDVSAMEGTMVSRLALQIAFPASLSPNLDAGGAADGMIRFDPKKLSAMGHSMGSTLAMPIASVDPRINAFIYSGSGGSLIDVALSTTYPQNLKPFVELLLELPSDQHLWHGHPLVHVFQALWDLTDPTNKARYTAKEPLPSVGRPRPYLQFAGQVDGYFHPQAQQSIVIALGGPLVGEVIEPSHLDALRLDGRGQVDYPQSKNFNGVTAGVVQYQTPFELGHYVVFDLSEARHQYLCFLQGVGTDDGPKIVAKAEDTAPCQ